MARSCLEVFVKAPRREDVQVTPLLDLGNILGLVEGRIKDDNENSNRAEGWQGAHLSGSLQITLRSSECSEKREHGHHLAMVCFLGCTKAD